MTSEISKCVLGASQAGGKSAPRVLWMDVAKAIAIFAVILDHTREILYTNPVIPYVSFCSVSLFIFVMGVLQYPSFAKSGVAVPQTVLRKVWRIYRPYAIATIVYSCFLDKMFVLGNIWNRLLFFNAGLHLYYIALYIQLLVVSPLLVYWVQNGKGWGTDILGFAAVTGVAILTTNHSNILDLFGGGGKLFGGTYLMLLYAGIWFGKHQANIARQAQNHREITAVCAAAFAALAVAWIAVISKNQAAIDAVFPFGYGINPPGICIGLYAVLVAGAVFCVCNLADFGEGGMWAPLAWVGRNTLPIFLYHWLIRDFLRDGTVFMNDWPIWPKRLVWYSLMVVLPVLFGRIIDWLEGLVAKAYGK